MSDIKVVSSGKMKMVKVRGEGENVWESVTIS